MKKLLLLLLAIGLIGCAEKAPECGSDTAQDLVLQLVEPKLFNHYHLEYFLAVRRGEASLKVGDEFTDEEFNTQVNLLSAEQKPRLEMIITNGSDDKTLSSTCSAHITDKSNADILNVEYQLNTSSDDQLVARVWTN